MLRMLSLSVALTLTMLPAFAEEPEKKPDAKIERGIIKAYRLKNAEVGDTLDAFNGLIGPENTVHVRPPAPVKPKEIGDRFDTPPPVPQGWSSMHRNPATTLADLEKPTGVACHALGDPRTRSLIVRGTEKDLQLAADLAAVLDTPEDKPLPATPSLTAFRLQHLDVDDFAEMLLKLEPNHAYRVVAIGRLKLVIVNGTDEQRKEVADAVKELDIPAPTK